MRENYTVVRAADATGGLGNGWRAPALAATTSAAPTASEGGGAERCRRLAGTCRRWGQWSEFCRRSLARAVRGKKWQQRPGRGAVSQRMRGGAAAVAEGTACFSRPLRGRPGGAGPVWQPAAVDGEDGYGDRREGAATYGDSGQLELRSW